MLTGRKLELVVNVRSGRKVSLLRPALFKGKQYKVDVRNFITDSDAVIHKIVDENELSVHTGSTVHFDKTMKKCWEWVRDNLTYTYDMLDETKIDFWQLPGVTVQHKQEDCDSMATVLASLAMCAGIPYYRIQVALGHVGKDPKAPSGAHAYVLFLNESGKWETWESTSKTTGYKGITNELLGNSWYIDIYNTFNLKHCFKHTKLVDYANN